MFFKQALLISHLWRAFEKSRQIKRIKQVLEIKTILLRLRLSRMCLMISCAMNAKERAVEESLRHFSALTSRVSRYAKIIEINTK